MHPKHPFVRLLMGVINGHIADYEELLKIFPLQDEFEYLTCIPLSFENIWKFVPAKKKNLLESSLEFENDVDDSETSVESIVLLNPFGKEWVVKGFFSFYFRPYYLGVYVLILSVIGLIFWLRFRKLQDSSKPQESAEAQTLQNNLMELEETENSNEISESNEEETTPLDDAISEPTSESQ